MDVEPVCGVGPDGDVSHSRTGLSAGKADLLPRGGLRGKVSSSYPSPGQPPRSSGWRTWRAQHPKDFAGPHLGRSPRQSRSCSDMPQRVLRLS